MRSFIVTLTLALCGSFLRAALSAQDVTEGTLPLTSSVSASVDASVPFGEMSQNEQPIVTIGRLSENAERQFDLVAGSTVKGLPQAFLKVLSLSKNLLPTDAHSSTYLLLTGPRLNSDEDWQPVSLSRSGNTFKVVLESWTDNFPRYRNMPFVTVHLLPLGTLIAGHYNLRVELRGLFMDTTTAPNLYHLNNMKSGDVPFQVLGSRPTPGKQILPALRETQMQAITPPDREGLLYQPLFKLLGPPVHELYSNGASAIPVPGLHVGTFNFGSWHGAVHTEESARLTLSKDIPNVSQPSPGDPLYAEIVGPWLNSGEWMSLRSIGWKGNETTLNVEIWRDDGPRKRNSPYIPLLLVPLHPPRSTPQTGALKVSIHWNALRAPVMGGVYRSDRPAKAELASQGEQASIILGPDLAPPLISHVVITTQPSPLNPGGGTVTLKCVIQSPDGLNVTTDPPKVDVTRGGLSVLGGPQALVSLSSQKDTWAYQFTAPANANNFADDEYIITITASDSHGGKIDPPAEVGTFTVPNTR